MQREIGGACKNVEIRMRRNLADRMGRRGETVGRATKVEESWRCNEADSGGCGGERNRGDGDRIKIEISGELKRGRELLVERN